MKRLARTLSLLATGLLLVWGSVACDSRGSCAIVRVYGVRAIVRGGAVPLDPGNEGGAAGSSAQNAGEAGSAQSGSGQGGSGQGGAGQCRATVVAETVEHDYKETLDCQVTGEDCDCVGLTEIDGTYEVTATLDDREETQEATVRSNGCNVTTKELVFFED